VTDRPTHDFPADQTIRKSHIAYLVMYTEPFVLSRGLLNWLCVLLLM